MHHLPERRRLHPVVIKSIAKYRVEADHKVLSTSSDKQSYGQEFELLCKQFVSAANLFAGAVEAKNVT